MCWSAVVLFWELWLLGTEPESVTELSLEMVFRWAYFYTHVILYTYIHIYMDRYMRACALLAAMVYMHRCTSTYVCVCIVCVCMCVYVCVCVYIYIYIYMYVCILYVKNTEAFCMHAYIHAQHWTYIISKFHSHTCIAGWKRKCCCKWRICTHRHANPSWTGAYHTFLYE